VEKEVMDIYLLNMKNGHFIPADSTLRGYLPLIEPYAPFTKAKAEEIKNY